MTEALRPGAVSVSPNAFHPGVIVGSPPQWDDSSDDTYATTYLSVSSSGSVQARAYATLGTMTTPAAEVTAITLHIRCKTANSTAATGRRCGFTLWNPTVGDFAIFGYDPALGAYEAPADDAIHDLTIPMSATDLATFGTSLSVVAGRLAAGGVEFRAFRASPFGEGTIPSKRYDITVYEMGLEVNPSDDEPPVERWIRRPLRMHPRDDALGMSSAPRLDANRSIQASLRRAGNTHI